VCIDELETKVLLLNNQHLGMVVQVGRGGCRWVAWLRASCAQVKSWCHGNNSRVNEQMPCIRGWLVASRDGMLGDVV
jgi:hypothetical protein